MMGLSGKSRFVKQENLKPVIIFECDDEAMHPNYDATPNEGLIMTDIETYLTIAIEHIKKQGCKNVFQLCNGCPLKHADEVNDVNLCYWIREYNKDDSATPSPAVKDNDDAASIRTLSVLNDPELMEQIEESKKDIVDGNCVPLYTLMNEIEGK